MIGLRFVGLTTCLVAFSLGASVAVQAENWPGWRGPNGDGSSGESGVPTKWSAEENVAWKTKLTVGGHASPIVWNDRVYVVGAEESATSRVLVAIDRTNGEVLWQKPVLSSPLERKHRLNSWASSTPATDGERLYISFLDQKSMFVAAYSMEGDELWSERPGVFSSVHGYCSCPVIYKDKLIVNGDHDGDAYIVALDRATGKTLWKTPRENRTRSYCTPLIRTMAGRTQLMLCGSKSIASYNPDTGERYWVMDGPTEQFVASPVENKGLVFFTGGFPQHHMLAIDPSGDGNITGKEFVKWHHRQKGDNYVPSPIASGDYILVAGDGGVCYCFDAATGEIQWRERLGRHYSASLVSAGGVVYFLDDDGVTKVVKPGPKLEVISENPLGEATYASPAISHGQILIRGEHHLYAIGQ